MLNNQCIHYLLIGPETVCAIKLCLEGFVVLPFVVSSLQTF